MRKARPESGMRDDEKGLSLDLPVINYTSNRKTKDFILAEILKAVPDFKRRSGTRYLLNRWREEQLGKGRKLTYRDIVKRTIAANKTEPPRIGHARYINFISDFMRANRGAKRAEVLQAWEELKRMDVPKTYGDWEKARKRKAGRSKTP